MEKILFVLVLCLFSLVSCVSSTVIDEPENSLKMVLGYNVQTTSENTRHVIKLTVKNYDNAEMQTIKIVCEEIEQGTQLEAKYVPEGNNNINFQEKFINGYVKARKLLLYNDTGMAIRFGEFILKTNHAFPCYILDGRIFSVEPDKHLERWSNKIPPLTFFAKKRKNLVQVHAQSQRDVIPNTYSGSSPPMVGFGYSGGGPK